MWQKLSSRSKRRSPRLPSGFRIYAIGDVHGRADLLDQMLSRIDADLATYPDCRPLQVFLGDYVDRGPSSRGVLDRLIERSRTHDIVCLKGNHETCMLGFLRNPAILADWQQIGGLETLMSYGLTPSMRTNSSEQLELAKALAASLPKLHREFLSSLSPSFSCGDFFFVHAGVKPGVPLEHQREEDMLWIRDEFLFCEDDFGKIIVHGHTPVPEPDIRPNRINIDTGAYATGRLTCLIIESGGFFVL